MATQWPLVIFTLFVCITCGVLGGLSILSLKGKAGKIQLSAVALAAISLVIGGIGSFTHLQHWERIFNGFGHITSGITQELIGCVVLVVLIVIWFILMRGDKAGNKALAWVTLIAAIAMVCATAHSYLMPGRPAWGFGLVLFYLGSACMLGGAIVWMLAVAKSDEDASAPSQKLALIGSIAALATEFCFIALAAAAKFTNFGHYLNPTLMTTHPTHIDNVASIALAGEGAPLFWLSIVCTVIAIACAVMAKNKPESAKVLAAICVIAALAASVMFRVIVYMVGYPVLLVY